MRRFGSVAIAVVALLTLVAACGGGSATSALTGKTWQLTAVTEKVPAFQGVIPADEQSKYTITFNTDGNYAGQADCNVIGGKYTTSGTNGIKIEAGISTMAFCGEASFDVIYIHALTTATTWAVANNELTLTNAEGGTLTFSQANGSSTPSAVAVSPEPLTSSAPAEGLVGPTWQLSAITEKVPAFQGVVPAADQSRYTIQFAEDGTFAAKADCNQVAGTYSAGASGELTIILGPSTLAMCPEDSLADLFTFGLSNAASYAVSGDQLTITLNDGGTLEFTKAAS